MRISQIKTMIREEKVAYHEAGHVVFNFLHGRPFKRVTIIPSSTYLGVVEEKERPNLFFLIVEHFDDPEECDRLIAELIFECLGGYAAQNIRTGQDCNKKSPDYQNALQAATYRDDNIENAMRLIDECWQETFRILRENWSSVEAIAAALLEKKTLSYDEARELIGPRE